MISDRIYAVPSSPFSMTPEELVQAREDLAHAEAEVQRATTWGHRTRAEQEVKSLKARMRGAEIQQRVDAQHAAVNRRRPSAMTLQQGIERGVEEGRYMPCRPYFAEQATASETELEKLKAEAKQLQAILDDSAASVAIRTNAQLRLTAVRTRIEALEAALHPVTEIGQPATAGNSRILAAVSFEDAGKLLALAHAVGMIKQ